MRGIGESRHRPGCVVAVKEKHKSQSFIPIVPTICTWRSPANYACTLGHDGLTTRT